MSGNKLLLDTNIILYLLNGDRTLVDILEHKQVYVSFITELELYSFKGLNTLEKSKIDILLSSCSIIDVNAGIKSKTVEIRQSCNIKLADSIIAGTALYLDLPLITADSDFKKVTQLALIHYQNT